ncbi:protein-methionine sulfoxide oxidase mical3b-like [Sander vitreus]
MESSSLRLNVVSLLQSETSQAGELFDEFVSAETCRAALWSFSQLCEHLQLDRSATERLLYRPIKQRLNYWRANALWAKLDRRAAQSEYLRGGACSNTTCVIIGAGPCGLRTAVELSFLGARVVLLEKRDSFSRNNVLHLWPFTIHDLRGLGAKKFYGKFCAGSIDHISIRQLQLVLLKVALLLGVEVHVNVEFKKLVEPPEDQHRCKVGWRMEVSPRSHPLNQLEFDVIIGADGRRNTLPGFRRKEFRGKLAIAITANFKNRNTTAEAKVEEISGVAFIFNQRFFQELRQETGIDLENIVYYKDDTHYFVMTAKKQSLLQKRVIKKDFADTALLLSRANVDQNALQAYAREAADFSTNHQLPSLDFAVNQRGQPDLAMFDFTCMYASENAATVRQRHGHQLLVTLVGDSLLEPFWPMGTGIARGFLAALDSAWMIRRWSQGAAPLDVLADRESLYRLLPQTTPENLQKNFNLFTVDPTTRYLNTKLLLTTPDQVRHLVDTGEGAGLNTACGDIVRLPPPQSSLSRSNQLLTWCQEQTRGYRGVAVNDLTTSWESGLALCALIHRYRPDLIDFDSLDESCVDANTRLALDVSERYFGIRPVMTVDEMWSDSLSVVMYLSQFYQLLRDTAPPTGVVSQSSDLRSAVITPASRLSRLSNTKDQREALKRRRKSQQSCDLNGDDVTPVCDEMFVGGSRVRLMANQLQAKLDERFASCRSSSSAAAAASHRQQGELLSDSPLAAGVSQTPSWTPRKRTLQQEQMSFRFREKIKSQTSVTQEEQVAVCGAVCFFCQQRVYLMERLSAESLFFHRSCFQCSHCSSTLRLGGYCYDTHSRRFYCLQHATTRTRTSLSDITTSHQASIVSLGSASAVSAERRRSSVASVMATPPETVEPESHHRSSTKEEAGLLEKAGLIEEVEEETLERFNMSVQEKHRYSSESEMEEEEEEEEEEGRGRHCVSSEEAGASWRETLQQNLELRDDEEEDQEEQEEEDQEEQEEEDQEEQEEEDQKEEEDQEEEEQEEEQEEGEEEEEGEEQEEEQEQEQEEESSDGELYFSPSEFSQRVSSSAGSDVTGCDSSSSPPPETPSTASFVTPTDSNRDRDPPTPAVVMETAATGGRGSVDDDSPELSPKKQGRGAEPEREGAESEGGRGERRSFPYLQRERGGGATKRGGGARVLWSTVFSGNRKDGKKKKRVRTLPLDASNQRRATDGVLTEESDLDSSALLQRCSLKPRKNKRSLKDKVPLKDSISRSSCSTEVLGVIVLPKEPSSLSVKETLFQMAPEDKDLDAEITRRVQKAARRKAKQEQLKRLHKAQMIQRQLQQVEEKQRQLEERGVMVEKALRGEADYWGDSSDSQDTELHLEGMGKLENPALMQQWFQLVQQKNSLVRYESELMIFARELELEDRQSRLQTELRERMAVDDHLKEEWQLLEERLILEEMLDVVEQRDALVSLLEEQRLQHRQEDQDLERLSWT